MTQVGEPGEALPRWTGSGDGRGGTTVQGGESPDSHLADPWFPLVLPSLSSLVGRVAKWLVVVGPHLLPDHFPVRGADEQSDGRKANKRKKNGARILMNRLFDKMYILESSCGGEATVHK